LCYTALHPDYPGIVPISGLIHTANVKLLTARFGHMKHSHEELNGTGHILSLCTPHHGVHLLGLLLHLGVMEPGLDYGLWLMVDYGLQGTPGRHS
jgi:hypothetical protein